MDRVFNVAADSRNLAIFNSTMLTPSRIPVGYPQGGTFVGDGTLGTRWSGLVERITRQSRRSSSAARLNTLRALPMKASVGTASRYQRGFQSAIPPQADLSQSAGGFFRVVHHAQSWDHCCTLPTGTTHRTRPGSGEMKATTTRRGVHPYDHCPPWKLADSRQVGKPTPNVRQANSQWKRCWRMIPQGRYKDNY